MRLLEKYKNISKEEEIFNKYYKCGEKALGNMFFFKNTNFRYMTTFEENYNIFKRIDGIDRREWAKNPSYKQENDKHRTVRMFGTKLFSKNERIYYKTEKGNVMEALSTEKVFTPEEKWLLIYLLILDSYFENKSNYILNRSQYVIENFIASGYDENAIEERLKEIIKSQENKKSEIAKYDYLYMDTFFQPYDNNLDFLSEYCNATNEEKEELHNYVKKNIKENNSICIISKKFETSGNYDKKMLIENAKTLFMNKAIYGRKNISFDEFIKDTIDRYLEIENIIDKEKVIKFIYKHKDVFEIIYFNIYEIDYLGIETTEETDGEVIEEKIDDTSIKNIGKLKRISKILKGKAKERTGYKCELEDFCKCNNFYFTSKETKQNYLEIHHFIPREFGNEFERSIEVIENYIALCPRCHRMIHLAVDRERKTLISAIYNRRIQSLKNKGLEVSLDKIEEFYNIED